MNFACADGLLVVGTRITKPEETRWKFIAGK